MRQYYRKYFHIILITPFVVLAFFMDNQFPRSFYIIIGMIIVALIFGAEFLRLRNDHFNRRILTRFHHLFKENEHQGVHSLLWGAVNLLLLPLFFSKSTVIFALLIIGYCDPLAALIGKKYGKNPNIYGKTGIGSLAFFLSAVSFLLLTNYLMAFNVPFWLLIILSAMSTVIENRITFLDDNFIVPMSFALAMELSLFLL